MIRLIVRVDPVLMLLNLMLQKLKSLNFSTIINRLKCYHWASYQVLLLLKGPFQPFLKKQKSKKNEPSRIVNYICMVVLTVCL